MSSPSPFSQTFSPRLQRLLNKSLDTLDTLLSGDELPFETRVAIASRVVEFSTIVMAAGDEDANGNEQNRIAEIPSDRASAKGTTMAIAPNQNKSSVVSNGTSSLSFLPATYVQFDDFLSAEVYAALEAIIQDQKDQFQPTSVVRDNKSQQTDTRQSMVLYESNFLAFSQQMKQKILKTLPIACKKLSHPRFEPSNIVAQLTAHNDGCFYKRHSDAASAQTATREMTYVYYFYREPQPFSGGELRIYDTELNNDRPTSRGTYKTVTPRNNSIIFFNSRCLHEVMPVCCPSREFEDSRFTINGWIRR